MSKLLLKEGLGWGILLWFIGYILGIILFMVVPTGLIGWVITPLGIALTLWVLIKKVKSRSMSDLFKIAIVWTVVAVIFDYIFVVKLLKPADGYYKLDVYLYYALTFLLPVFIGWYRSRFD